MNRESISHRLVFIGMMALILFCEAIFVLLSFFKKGVSRREILSDNSKLGFDIVIKKWV